MSGQYPYQEITKSWIVGLEQKVQGNITNFLILRNSAEIIFQTYFDVGGEQVGANLHP